MSLNYSLRSQTGSALIMAVFILVVLGLLAASLTKVMSGASDQVIQEVLGTRALLAAESGNERTLAQLFPIDGSPAVCASEQRFYFDSSVAGLVNCAVESSCNEQVTGGLNYYSVVSTGICKQGFTGNQTNDFTCRGAELCVSRTLEVEAKAL